MALVVDINKYRVTKAIQEVAERIKNDIHFVRAPSVLPLSSKELLQKSRDLQIPLYDLIMEQKKSQGH